MGCILARPAYDVCCPQQVHGSACMMPRRVAVAQLVLHGRGGWSGLPARKSDFLTTGKYATWLSTDSLPLKAVGSMRVPSAERLKGPGGGSDVNSSQEGTLARLLCPIAAPEGVCQLYQPTGVPGGSCRGQQHCKWTPLKVQPSLANPVQPVCRIEGQLGLGRKGELIAGAIGDGLLVLPTFWSRSARRHCFLCSCLAVCMDCNRCSHCSVASRAACLSHRRSTQRRRSQAPVTCFSQNTGAVGTMCAQLALLWPFTMGLAALLRLSLLRPAAPIHSPAHPTC